MKLDKKQRKTERYIYIGIIIALVLYGLFRTEAAVQLMESVKNAFSILF